MQTKTKSQIRVPSSRYGLTDRGVRQEEEPEYVGCLGAPERRLEQRARAIRSFRGDLAAALGRERRAGARRGAPALDAEAEGGQGLRPRRSNGSKGRRGEVGGDAAGGGAAEDGDGRRRHGRGLTARREAQGPPFCARSGGVWWPAMPARRYYHVATWLLTVAPSVPATSDRRIHRWWLLPFRDKTANAGRRELERVPSPQRCGTAAAAIDESSARSLCTCVLAARVKTE